MLHNTVYNHVKQRSYWSLKLVFVVNIAVNPSPTWPLYNKKKEV